MCLLISNYLFASILYLFVFAYAKSKVAQIFIQFVYVLVTITTKELFFINAKNRIFMYVIELTGNFFTAMAFPTVTANVIFGVHLMFEASGIAYQMLRLTKLWFTRIELKYMIVFRSYLLGGGIIEELIAWIAYKTGRVVPINPESHPTALDFKYKKLNTIPDFIGRIKLMCLMFYIILVWEK